MPAVPHASVAEPESFPAAAADAAPFRGHAHFLTVGTLFRRPLFLDPDAARAVSRCQADAGIWGASRCLAWVLMPDRWHGLVVMDEGESLDPLVRRFKAITARGVDPRFRVDGWLWAKGYNQRLLDRQEDLLAVARHLVANPVRAGLASSVGSYPYWNSAWLDGKRRAADLAPLLAGAQA